MSLHKYTNIHCWEWKTQIIIIVSFCNYNSGIQTLPSIAPTAFWYCQCYSNFSAIANHSFLDDVSFKERGIRNFTMELHTLSRYRSVILSMKLKTQWRKVLSIFPEWQFNNRQPFWGREQFVFSIWWLLLRLYLMLIMHSDHILESTRIFHH